MASKKLTRRIAVVALVVLAVAFGSCGHAVKGGGGNPHNPVGLWEGPL